MMISFNREQPDKPLVKITAATINPRGISHSFGNGFNLTDFRSING